MGVEGQLEYEDEEKLELTRQAHAILGFFTCHNLENYLFFKTFCLLPE